MASVLERVIQSHRSALLAGDARAVGLTIDRFQQIRATLMDRLDELVKIATANGNLSGGEVLKLERVVSLLDDIETAIDALSGPSARLIESGQRQAAQLAVEHARALVVAQRASVGLEWNRANIEAIQSMAGRLADGSPLRTYLDGLGSETSKKIQDALIDGIGTGVNPQDLAARLAKTVDIAGWKLAQTTRTAMLSSYRDASIETYKKNLDVLEPEWEWISAKQSRTCAACLSLDGTKHPIEEGFQKAHVSCRCSMLPIVKGAPPIERELGSEWLAKQPETVQDGILGKTGGAEYRAGNLALEDFVTLDKNKRWGDSYRVSSLNTAYLNAERRTIAALPKKAPVVVDDAPFIRSTTLGDAESYARSLGANDVAYGKAGETLSKDQAKRTLLAANATNEAVFIASKRGVPIPPNLRVINDANNKKTMAFMRVRDETMHANTSAIFWKDPASRIKDFKDAKWMTADDATDVMLHEIGHFADFKKSGMKSLDWTIEGNKALRGDDKTIAMTVSRYAATTRTEFVAEVFVQLIRGRKVSPEVLNLYRRFGGYEP